MAVSPGDALFPLATAITVAAFSFLLLRRSDELGERGTDWVLAQLFAALAFAAVFGGVLVEWNEGGEAALATAAASASLAMMAPFSRLLQSYTRRFVGSATFRWLSFSAAASIGALGWGALAGGRAAPGDGVVGSWVILPASVLPVVLVALGWLATGPLLRAGAPAGPILLFSGLVVFSAGLVSLSLGQVLVGSALGMAGAGLVYTGAPAAAAGAPETPPPIVRPRVERDRAGRPTSGVKVRIPKGEALRVSSFTDDEAPGDTRP